MILFGTSLIRREAGLTADLDRGIAYLCRAVHQARLTAEKSGTKHTNFLYNWIRPKAN